MKPGVTLFFSYISALASARLHAWRVQTPDTATSYPLAYLHKQALQILYTSLISPSMISREALRMESACLNQISCHQQSTTQPISSSSIELINQIKELVATICLLGTLKSKHSEWQT